jgi:hypothetical protein
MLEKIEFKNTSIKRLEVFIEPDAETFNVEPEENMIIYLKNSRPKYKDGISFEHDGSILTIYQPRQSDIEIFINNKKVFYSSPNRPMWEEK